ncbi:hypothetical protein FJY71_00770 [candidate division WOR-3 bacterium]|nr:hypothetical protein [candidate division WOR-3 bacterium]
MMKSALVLLAAAAATAAVIRVPSQQPTIQAGLNAALSGDTVLVAAGTYYEQLTWPGVDGIQLLSEAGAESTAIDGAGSGRVVTMTALDYTGATKLCGFTLAHGRILNYPGNGAGLWCRGAPELCHNRIVNNRMDCFGYGGGAFAEGAPLFHDNLVAWDSIVNEGGGGWRYGAGVFCSGSGVFYQNVFFENGAMGGAGGFWYGGGIYLAGGTPLVFSNLFLCNRMGTTTGGIAYGAGIYVDSAQAYIVNNTFAGNVCSTAIACGAGVFVQHNWTSVIWNNIFAENACQGIAPNAGAIASYPDTLGDTLAADFNNVWGNLPNDYYGVKVGPGSLNADPLFVAGVRGDFYLSQILAGQPDNSPCVDAGTAVRPDVDSLLRTWTTRTDSGPDSAAPDMGYHYRWQPLVGTEQRARSEVRRVRGGPTVFRGVVLLPASPGAAHSSLFDLAGREVAVLGPGPNEVSYLAPGAYILRTSAGAARVVILR